MAYLKEDSVWTDPVYLIERHDPLMGGEYGINNVQARQLANRTLYLLDRLLRGHGEDGSHNLTEAAIAKDAGILESKLSLDYPTAFLAGQIDKLDKILRLQTKHLEDLSASEISFFGPLYEAIRLCWRFGYPRFAFELFNMAFTMRPGFSDLPIIETISGDDSIDVSDSSTLKINETYILWDEMENRSAFAVVKEILTDRRVILHSTEGLTRKSAGVLTKMSWRPGRYGMIAKKNSKYISDKIDILRGVPGGNLCIVCRAPVSFDVEILREGYKDPTCWEKLPLVSAERSPHSGLWKSIFKVPCCVFHFRITVLDDCEIDHLAIVSDNSKKLTMAIRTPEVVDNDFTIVRFGALYDIRHQSTHFDLSRTCDFSNACIELSFGPDTSELPVWDYRMRVLSSLGDPEIGDEYWWRAWYTADNGLKSNYSGLGHYVHPQFAPR